VKYKINQKVKCSVMFDTYQFIVIGIDAIKKKYQLQWLGGNGSFWADESKVFK